MHSRRPYEPSRWPLELNTKMNHREAIGQFFDCQRFLYPTRRCARSLKKSPDGTSDGLRCPHEWPNDHTITADCQHFLHRVSIGGQHRHSVKPTLRVASSISTASLVALPSITYIIICCFLQKYCIYFFSYSL